MVMHNPRASKTDRIAALLHVEGTGAFTFTGSLDQRESLLIEAAPLGSLTIVRMAGDRWSEVSLLARRLPGTERLLQRRVTTPSSDGGLVARSTIVSSAGFTRVRELRAGSEGRRDWTGTDTYADGSTLSVEGTFATGKTTLTRRRCKAGQDLWAERSETVYDATAPPLANGARPRTMTLQRTVAGRSLPSVRHVVSDRRAFAGAGERDRVPADERTIYEATLLNPDGTITTITTEVFPDGSRTITNVTETEEQGPLWDPSLPTYKETTVTAVSADGSSSVMYHEINRSSMDPATGTQSGSDELTLSDSQGNTTTESRGWSLDLAGNSSETTSRTTPDGTTTITTRTVDANGNGRVTTTVYRPDGTVETTEVVLVLGEPEPEPSPAPPDSGGSGGGGGGGSGSSGGGPGSAGGSRDGSGSGGFLPGPDPGLNCNDTDGDSDKCPPVMKPGDHRTRTVSEIVGRILDATEESSRRAPAVSAVLGEQVTVGLREALAAGQGRGRCAVRLTVTDAHAISETLKGLDPMADDPHAAVAFATAVLRGVAQQGTGDGVAVARALLVCQRLAGMVRSARPAAMMTDES